MQDVYNLLLQAEQAADTTEQCRICNRILEECRDHLPALELKSKALWRNKDFAGAIEAISKAIAINPGEPGYYFLRGDCLQNLSRYADAVHDFERCRETGDEKLRREAETRLLLLSEWQEGIVAELLRADPSFSRSYAADPQATMKAFGFAFAEATTETQVHHAELPSLWARPS